MVDILNPGDISILDQVNPYNLDGRMSIAELYKNYDRLLVAGWSKELVYEQTLDWGRKLPVYAYISPGESDKWLWILSGVHGEEPAGPNELADKIEQIKNLPLKGISVVMIPVLNPLGYSIDWRYPDEKRDHTKGHSVTDAEHVLPKLDDSSRTRAEAPTSEYAREVFIWIASKVVDHPPLLVVDHHEDNIDETEHIDSGFTYSYAYGPELVIQNLCAKLSEGLEKHGFPMEHGGVTRFGERISESGFVINSWDGSVDEYLYRQGAKAVFVIETIRDDNLNIPLENRKAAHGEVVDMYEELWVRL